MSKTYKIVGIIGVVGAFLSSVSMAAPPFAFDGWSVSDGDIATDVACPAGFSCGAAVIGKGFFQRQITEVATGDDYFQTIITDVDSTGDPDTPSGTMQFADESFVKQGNATGLANKSSSFDSTATGTITEVFESSTELLTGWANDDGSGTTTDRINVYQSISAVDTAAEDFDSQFWLSQIGDQGATGKHMRIAGTVEILDGVSSQDFVLVDLSGPAFVTGAGTADLGTDGTMTWAIGDNIKAIWVGQDMSGIAGVAQEFGYTAYEDDAADVVSTFLLTAGAATTPVDWDEDVWGVSAPDGVGPF